MTGGRGGEFYIYMCGWELGESFWSQKDQKVRGRNAKSFCEMVVK